MAAARTFYEILNVSPDAELVVVEAAYRALMKKYHPDQGGGAAAGPSAAEINRAYAVLRDAERRADYDHKEWIRQRDIQLASYQPPPPPRRSNFFGWGGWLVAAVLAGMIALMASRGSAPQLSAAEQARAAAMATTEHRSQPLTPDGPVVTAAEAAEIRAAAFAPRARDLEPPKAEAPAAPPSTSPPLVVAAVPAPTPAAVAPRVAARAAPHRIYTRRAPLHHRGAALAHRRNKDFLERQGYIY